MRSRPNFDVTARTVSSVRAKEAPRMPLMRCGQKAPKAARPRQVRDARGQPMSGELDTRAQTRGCILPNGHRCHKPRSDSPWQTCSSFGTASRVLELPASGRIESLSPGQGLLTCQVAKLRPHFNWGVMCMCSSGTFSDDLAHQTHAVRVWLSDCCHRAQPRNLCLVA